MWNEKKRITHRATADARGWYRPTTELERAADITPCPFESQVLDWDHMPEENFNLTKAERERFERYLALVFSIASEERNLRIWRKDVNLKERSKDIPNTKTNEEC